MSKDSLWKNSLRLLCAGLPLVLALPICAAPLWAQLNITGSKVTDGGIGVLEYDKTTNQLFAGSIPMGLRSSRDEGQTWQVVTAAASCDFVIDSVNPSHMYLSSGDGVLRTEDGGQSWGMALHTQSHRFGFIFHSVPSVYSIAIDQNDHSTVYAVNDDGLWKSVDSGQTWKQLPSLSSFQTIVSEPTVAHLLAIGPDLDVLRRSTDGGKNWTRVERRFLGSPLAPPAGSPVGTPARIAFDPTNSATLYATFASQGFYISRDAGLTWKEANAGAPPAARAAGDIVVDPARPAHIFRSAVGAGVFESQDYGASWQDISGNISDKHVTRLLLINHKLYAVTWGPGLNVTTVN